jgi:predicted ATPase
MMAEGLNLAGRAAEALAVNAEAQRLAVTTGERWYEATILWQLGHLLTNGPPRALDEAEVALRESLKVARRQGARSLELRAAMSLARLWAEQGDLQKARDLLAPVYEWFTEGFETADRKEAKALLDELG